MMKRSMPCFLSSILLNDESFFSFSNEDSVRLSFVQNPRFHFSKAQFIVDAYLTGDESEEERDEAIEELYGFIDDEEYEQYLSEQKLNSQATIIRFDASDKGYVPLVHSYAHFHVGLSKHLRIPTSLIVSPLSFTSFVLQKFYYSVWKNSIEHTHGFSRWVRSFKGTCSAVDSKFWKKQESELLHIS